MDPSLAMILPKGFVVNSDEIYQEIAKYPVLPPEKNREYWLVYNTTFRELKDPTARRLENFWWRVWGSDRKNLSGTVLAKRFEDISTRPPFVHIPGPPNRWEPPPEVVNLLQMLQKHASQQAKGQNGSSKDSNKDKPKSSVSKSSDTSVKTLASSASKPPPPHPILKKSRGDSKSGPRPTARFVSPHESSDEGESERTGGGTSSGSTSGKGLEMRGSTATPSKSEKKKTSTPTKKFHASTTATKRRPALQRRPSSQSSTSSEVITKEVASSAGSRYAGSQRTVAPIAEQANIEAIQVQQSLATSESSQRSALSSKAAGKRPATRSPTSKKSPREELRHQAVHSSHDEKEITLPETSETAKPQYSQVSARQPTAEEHYPPPRAMLQRVQSSDLTNKSSMAPPAMTRSQSHVEARRLQDMSIGRSVPRGLTSKAATTMTTTDSAAGTIIAFDQPPPASNAPGPDEEDFELVRRLSTSSLLDSRFVPTQPSTAPTLPLGRTKSQLTLLLEKEKERKGGKPSKN